MAYYYLNGELVPAGECSVPVTDRSYLLGDGLFETIQVDRGRALFLVRHLQRLAVSAAFLGMELPAAEQLAAAVKQFIQKNGLLSGSLRLTVSRNEGRGVLPAAGSSVNILITVREGSPYPEELYKRGMKAVISKSTRRNNLSPLSRHKTTCFLDGIIARSEAEREGADEALLLNVSGAVAEGSISNLFIVSGSIISTPPVKDGALPGIVRAVIMEICHSSGLTCREETIMPEAAFSADEAFLTNSLLGVMPLVALDGLPIGKGTPGPTTIRLTSELRGHPN